MALFAPWFVGDGDLWFAWRCILKAAFALKMDDREIEFFRSIADRDPPKQRVRELWVIGGRRGGKDSIASLIIAHAAALFDGADKLRPGERALCMCLACDREQAKIVLDYSRSYFSDIELLRDAVMRETSHGFATRQCRRRVDLDEQLSRRARPSRVCCGLRRNRVLARREIAPRPTKRFIAPSPLAWRRFLARC